MILYTVKTLILQMDEQNGTIKSDLDKDISLRGLRESFGVASLENSLAGVLTFLSSANGSGRSVGDA